METATHTFAPTLKLIRQISVARNGGWRRTFWKARQASLILLNLSKHRELARTLTTPKTIGFTHIYPKLLYKYLWEDYLVHGFHRNKRLDILINHYGFLEKRVNADFFVKAYTSSHTLWELTKEENTYRIGFSFPKGHDYEGDLRLTFEVNGQMVYWMLFTIVPGHVVGSAKDQVFMVTAMQGASGQIETLRATTKAFNDTAPVHLLLAALEGLGLALGVSQMVGLGCDQQVQRQMSKHDTSFVFDYDAFWTSLIGERTSSGYYASDLPFPQKPLETIKHNHRSRAVKRRANKQQVAEQVQINLRAHCLA